MSSRLCAGSCTRFFYEVRIHIAVRVPETFYNVRKALPIGDLCIFTVASAVSIVGFSLQNNNAKTSYPPLMIQNKILLRKCFVRMRIGNLTE